MSIHHPRTLSHLLTECSAPSSGFAHSANKKRIMPVMASLHLVMVCTLLPAVHQAYSPSESHVRRLGISWLIDTLVWGLPLEDLSKHLSLMSFFPKTWPPSTTCDYLFVAVVDSAEPCQLATLNFVFHQSLCSLDATLISKVRSTLDLRLIIDLEHVVHINKTTRGNYNA